MATKNEKDGSTMQIVGAVRHKGRLFTAGSEAELAKTLPRKDIDRLVEKGVLTGNWGGKSAATSETSETSTASSGTSTSETDANAGASSSAETTETTAAKKARKPAAKRARGK